MPKDLVIPIENETMVIAKGSEQVRANVERRLFLGMGAKGALPKPKDGGAPMRRTGRLAANITYHLKLSRRGVIGVVTASGNRPTEEVANKAKNAARKQREARKLASVTGEYQGRQLSRRRVRSKYSPSGFVEKVSVGRIRFRAAKTNHNLAAILSVPPKPSDKRGYNGHRGRYVVFDENNKDIQDFLRVVNENLKPRMK